MKKKKQMKKRLTYPHVRQVDEETYYARVTCYVCNHNQETMVVPGFNLIHGCECGRRTPWEVEIMEGRFRWTSIQFKEVPQMNEYQMS